MVFLPPLPDSHQSASPRSCYWSHRHTPGLFVFPATWVSVHSQLQRSIAARYLRLGPNTRSPLRPESLESPQISHGFRSCFVEDNPDALNCQIRIQSIPPIYWLPSCTFAFLGSLFSLLEMLQLIKSSPSLKQLSDFGPQRMGPADVTASCKDVFSIDLWGCASNNHVACPVSSDRFFVLSFQYNFPSRSYLTLTDLLGFSRNGSWILLDNWRLDCDCGPPSYFFRFSIDKRYGQGHGMLQ